MSPDDRDPRTHRISRAEDRERILAEALAHVEAQDAQYRLPMEAEERQPRWKPVTAVLLLTVAVWIALFPPAILRGERPPVVPAGERTRGARAVLYLQAQQIEAFRLREGRLPNSLSEIPVRFPGVSFVRSNNRVYQLVAHRPDGRTVVYDSSFPAPGFAAIAAPWRGEESK